MKMPELDDYNIFGEIIEDLVDNAAGDLYEGWPSYWTEREARIEKIKAELRAWQQEAKVLHESQADTEVK